MIEKRVGRTAVGLENLNTGIEIGNLTQFEVHAVNFRHHRLVDIATHVVEIACYGIKRRREQLTALNGHIPLYLTAGISAERLPRIKKTVDLGGQGFFAHTEYPLQFRQRCSLGILLPKLLAFIE